MANPTTAAKYQSLLPTPISNSKLSFLKTSRFIWISAIVIFIVIAASFTAGRPTSSGSDISNNNDSNNINSLDTEQIQSNIPETVAPEVNVSNSFIVMLDEDVSSQGTTVHLTQNQLKVKNNDLMAELKEKYKVEITHIYESIFYGFSYSIPSNDENGNLIPDQEAASLAVESSTWLRGNEGVSVEADQVIHAISK
jgi:hypothetical protein